jgi:hypothetical protein
MKKTFSTFNFQLLILLLCTTVLNSCASNNNGDKQEEVPEGYFTLAVQPNNLQQIRGWGIYPGHTLPPEKMTSINIATEARRVLFEELGITMFRVCLEANCGASYTATNRTLTPAYIDDLAELINYAAGKGIPDYLISMWSPPYHMKEVYDADSDGNHNYRPRLKANDYDLFVAYVVDALKYLKSKGCPLPVALSLQNEPDGGVVATPDDIGEGATFIGGIDLAVALFGKMRPALDAAGFSSVKLGAPESPSYEGSWIFRWPPLTSSQLSKTDIHMVHSYSDTPYDDNNAAKVKDPLTEFLRVKGNIGKESWQTEFSVAGTGGQGKTAMERLMHAMRIFSSDIVWAGHTVWMWWCGWFPGWSVNSADQQVLLGGNGVSSVEKAAMFDAFATIFNSVPKGSYARKVTSSDPSLKTDMRLQNDLVAFQTENGTFIVLVNGTDAQKPYYISGLAGQAGTLKTIAGNDTKTTMSSDFVVSSSGTAKVTVPKNSVNFILTN